MSAAPKLATSPHPLFGRSIDLNLLGTKAKLCSFDCRYCSLGPTLVRLNKLKEEGMIPTIEDVLQTAREQMRQVHEHGPAIDTVTISGLGEPTIHPDFPEIVSGLIDLRNQWLPKIPLVLFTNGANLDQRKILEAVNKLDQRFVKVDAGNERVFKLMNTPLSRVNLQKILSGIRLLKDVSIQAMFTQGVCDNTLAPDIDDWIEVMGLLRPKQVLIQSVSLPPHTDGLRRCDEDTLHTIASKLERRTGLKAIVLS